MLHRRGLLRLVAGAAAIPAVMQRALAAQLESGAAVNAEMVRQAEWIAGIEYTDEQREELAESLRRSLRDFEALRQVDIDYSTAPALQFNPAPYLKPAARIVRDAQPTDAAPPELPLTDEQLAFLPVTELAALLRTRRVTSRKLTKLSLARLKRFNPLLRCVMTITEELALRQADQADREIAAGRYRGPLHGVPWGAKDLIAVDGHPTTWGAPMFKDRVLRDTATVARRLDDAGAVLVAKLTLGALAQGDHWYDQFTRNPWDPEQGSSGSSAGSASAVAAGLVPFALGSETLGSILSPAERCGVTGLRPTFGRVSRDGCMTLSWTMDKIGPITRSVEDAALVLNAIHGSDRRDPTAVDQPFTWPPTRDLRSLRVGYFKERADRPEMDVLRRMGVQLVEISLPDDLPVWPMTVMLNVEATAAFDEFARTGVEEGLNLWPATFRRHQFTPAVEYLRAARLRTKLLDRMEILMQTVDLYVEGDDLAITNLTGHPSVRVPSGFRERGARRTPRALKFTGRLFGESELLSVAHAYQQATGWHLERPPVERFLAEQQEAERRAAAEQDKQAPADPPE
ncbi:Glutamyl-tRNA(Gln) amidotransferase subunit A [Posidoniimonas corsicana]|uniref:Glutamyl-tRNA(Gln) amidotransferase subunit A n=1 Tax=Posidoniimonas corsicana TaxID=1938618 RepID=A0A5C5V5L6_9BACT|nr:amidase [Posidoniimonas corsicana]TWT33826.1 Glutamyl-tRNA(Gln) amidotransferase subunit A [Posidoniimonas corsicana]